jgi:hypothetical protein
MDIIDLLGIILLIYIIRKIINSIFPKPIQNHYSPNPKVKIKIMLLSLNKSLSEKFLAKEYRNCIAIADKILTIDPKNYKGLTARASSLANLNYHLDAIEDYQAALEIQNKDGNIHGLLGLTYRKVGEIEKSNYHLKRAIELGSKMYEMPYQLFLKLNDESVNLMIEKGKNSENQVRRNKADFEDRLSEADKEEYQKGLESANSALKASLEIDPDNKELQRLSEIIKIASIRSQGAEKQLINLNERKC